MKANKCIIIYDTVTGNTTKIAKAIAQVLKAKLVRCGKCRIKELGKCGLIGFGSGIYAMKHHKNLLKLVDKLPKTEKKAFVFSTAGSPALKFVWHIQLKQKLMNKGFEILGDFSCKGFDNFGPFKLVGGLNKGRPNANDILKAKQFARMIKQRIRA